MLLVILEALDRVDRLETRANRVPSVPLVLLVHLEQQDLRDFRAKLDQPGLPVDQAVKEILVESAIPAEREHQERLAKQDCLVR